MAVFNAHQQAFCPLVLIGPGDFLQVLPEQRFVAVGIEEVFDRTAIAKLAGSLDVRCKCGALPVIEVLVTSGVVVVGWRCRRVLP